MLNAEAIQLGVSRGFAQSLCITQGSFYWHFKRRDASCSISTMGTRSDLAVTLKRFEATGVTHNEDLLNSLPSGGRL